MNTGFSLILSKLQYGKSSGGSAEYIGKEGFALRVYDDSVCYIKILLHETRWD